MMEIGLIIKNKDLENTIILVQMNIMKAIGIMELNKDKVKQNMHMVKFLKVIFKMIKEMVMEL